MSYSGVFVVSRGFQASSCLHTEVMFRLIIAVGLSCFGRCVLVGKYVLRFASVVGSVPMVECDLSIEVTNRRCKSVCEWVWCVSVCMLLLCGFLSLYACVSLLLVLWFRTRGVLFFPESFQLFC